MMRAWVLFVLVFMGLCVQAQTFQNVLINDQGNPEEISICISPKDTNIMVAGANITNAYYSHDGGYTWQQQFMTDPYGVWGDPCIIADTAGTFYYIHLAKDPQITQWPHYCDRVILQTSADSGLSWDSTGFTGLDLPRMDDKAWAAIDPATNYAAVCWTRFDAYNSFLPTDTSRIFFSISKNGGRNWSAPVDISAITGNCVDSSQTVEGAVPAFGLHGEIYAVWSVNDSIYMNRSMDTGKTWLSREQLIATQPGGWAYSIEGLQRSNGMPVTLVDYSNSPNRGTIYISWTDKRNGPTDADVFFIKSSDGGQNFTAPMRVNDDPPGKENFMSTMAVDESNGDIYILYYDRRNYSDANTDVYMAYSFDGGNSFRNVKISNTSIFPVASTFFGDYIGISAVNGCVRPAWMRMDNGLTSVWTAIINKSQLATAIANIPVAEGFRLVGANPTGGPCIIHYDGNLPFEVSITDLQGKTVFQKHNETETFYMRMDEAGLSSGTYLVNCRNTISERSFKIVLMR